MSRCRVLIAGPLLALLVSQVPNFLQLTLTPDAVLYDVQARCLLEGGVLYRDVLEPNLPGVVWIHVAVRSVAGWSPEVLRMFDLIVVGCSCWLLVRIAMTRSPRTATSGLQRCETPSSGLSATFSPWKGEKGLAALRDARDVLGPPCELWPSGILFLTLLTFYLGTSEWCHCQRDVWMLLPGLLAVTLRLGVWRMMATVPVEDRSGQRRATFHGAPNRWNTPSSGLPATFSPCEGEKGLRDSFPEQCDESFTPLSTEVLPRFSKPIVAMAVLEGILWASAFWLKPFVAVPAIAVIIGSRRFATSFRLWGLHSVVVVSGGLLAGGVGILWMVQSGCWSYFIETLTGWNGDYFQSGRSRWTLNRYAAHAGRFWPWILLHAPALVVSIFGLFVRQVVSLRSPQSFATALLQSLYLGWMLQAFLLQQMFDYIHVSGVLLAIGVCGQWVSRAMKGSNDARTVSDRDWPSAQGLVSATSILFFCLAIVSSPLVRAARLKHWTACVGACFGGQLSPTTRDALALNPFPRWSELQPMLDHIQAKQIPDRSLVAYNGNLIHIYPELSFRPPTRFVYLDVLTRLFPDRRDQMTAAMEASRAKWVVSDLIEDGWEGELAADKLLPEEISRKRAEMFFPYNQTPVFRSGGYVLFRIDQPIGRLTDEYLPLSMSGE